MKESSWEDCLEYSVVKTSPDPKRAESLIETSEERLGIIKEISEKKDQNKVENSVKPLILKNVAEALGKIGNSRIFNLR